MLIASVLPQAVATAESFGDARGDSVFPAEESAVAGAVPSRRREFAAARHCARQALGRLGLPPVAIPSGLKREPCWPPSVVGSITHCEGYRAAAVAAVTLASSVGIDAESHRPLPEGVLDLVTSVDERAELDRLARLDGTVHWATLMFSAKESVYKAWYPLTRQWLGFEEASITIDTSACTFTAELLLSDSRHRDLPPVRRFTGRWRVDLELIVTATVVPVRAGTGS